MLLLYEVYEILAENNLNSNLADGQISFSVVDGEPYVKVGADSPRPFSSFKYGTFYIASYTETQSIDCGFRPKSVIIICNTTHQMTAYKSDAKDRFDLDAQLNRSLSGITLTNTGFDFCANENAASNWWGGETVYYLAFSDAVMG